MEISSEDLARRQIDIAKGGISISGIDERVMIQNLASVFDALREARSMLASCALDEPDDQLQKSWDRGIAKIDKALGR